MFACLVTYFRSQTMVRERGDTLAALGGKGILTGRCGDAALATHDWQTDLCNGQGIVPRSIACLHGRYSLGASGTLAKRYLHCLIVIFI